MILTLKNITKGYNSLKVLENINLEVKQGETIAIEGPSGSGKSTLLNICGALDSPDSGEILLEQTSYNGLDDNSLADIRNREIGFIFQEHLLLPQCSVIDNVLVPTIPLKINQKDRAVELLTYVGLENRLHSSVLELSTGEKQRVAIARSLINNPKVLLADEPTGSLDSSNSKTLGELLIKLNRDMDLTILCVTHSSEFAKFMSRRFVLDSGQLNEQ